MYAFPGTGWVGDPVLKLSISLNSRAHNLAFVEHFPFFKIGIHSMQG